VGINNLAHSPQPLYEMVPPNTPGFPVDSRFGPLITITSYGPVAGFDLVRQPTAEDLRDFAENLVPKLSALVAANPALTQ